MDRKMIDTSSLHMIASATSLAPGASVAAVQDRWTELKLFHRPGERRPFVAESFGRSRIPGEEDFHRQRVGKTAEDACRLFDNSRLHDEIARQVDDWERNRIPVMPAETEIKFVRRAGYDGQGGFIGALRWIYQTSDRAAERELASIFANDFGVPARTVRNMLAGERDGGDLTPWVQAFIAALRHFDRDAFHAARAS